jgi:F-box-like
MKLSPQPSPSLATMPTLSLPDPFVVKDTSRSHAHDEVTIDNCQGCDSTNATAVATTAAASAICLQSEDILQSVMSFLEGPDIGRASSVNRSWYTASASEWLWSSVYNTEVLQPNLAVLSSREMGRSAETMRSIHTKEVAAAMQALGVLVPTATDKPHSKDLKVDGKEATQLPFLVYSIVDSPSDSRLAFYAFQLGEFTNCVRGAYHVHHTLSTHTNTNTNTTTTTTTTTMTAASRSSTAELIQTIAANSPGSEHVLPILVNTIMNNIRSTKGQRAACTVREPINGNDVRYMVIVAPQSAKNDAIGRNPQEEHKASDSCTKQERLHHHSDAIELLRLVALHCGKALCDVDFCVYSDPDESSSRKFVRRWYREARMWRHIGTQGSRIRISRRKLGALTNRFTVVMSTFDSILRSTPWIYDRTDLGIILHTSDKPLPLWLANMPDVPIVHV